MKIESRKREEKYEFLQYCSTLFGSVALTAKLICVTEHNEVIHRM